MKFYEKDEVPAEDALFDVEVKGRSVVVPTRPSLNIVVDEDMLQRY